MITFIQTEICNVTEDIPVVYLKRNINLTEFYPNEIAKQLVATFKRNNDVSKYFVLIKQKVWGDEQVMIEYKIVLDPYSHCNINNTNFLPFKKVIFKEA